jgi:leader peptidase (prepilin peptidase)/N-methyltransferase
MEALIVVLIILLGLIFGSFLNVCITRLPRHESIVRPRSRCPHCGTPIAAWDNIPVLSYLL